MLESAILNREIWLYRGAVDFRKQLDGLVQLVASELERGPDDGSVYVFRNKGKTKLKLIVWDRNGFWMGYKRLEKGQFDWPVLGEGVKGLTWAEMYLLISGLPMRAVSEIPKGKVKHYF